VIVLYINLKIEKKYNDFIKRNIINGVINRNSNLSRGTRNIIIILIIGY